MYAPQASQINTGQILNTSLGTGSTFQQNDSVKSYFNSGQETITEPPLRTSVWGQARFPEETPCAVTNPPNKEDAVSRQEFQKEGALETRSTVQWCEKCNKSVNTIVKTVSRDKACVHGSIICLLGGFCGCCLIPCGQYKKVVHSCPHCKSRFGSVKIKIGQKPPRPLTSADVVGDTVEDVIIAQAITDEGCCLMCELADCALDGTGDGDCDCGGGDCDCDCNCDCDC